MNCGSKFVHSGSEGALTAGVFSDRNGCFNDCFVDDELVAVSELTALEIENHSERIASFIAELDTITKRACDAARKGAEHADRMEQRLLHERAALRGLLTEKVESVVGLELALAHVQRDAKNIIAEFQRRISAQESQIEEQRIELQHLRSGRDYVTSRIDETLVAVEAARVEAARMRDRWHSDAITHRLQVAEYEQWLVEKNRRLEKLESETQTTIEDLKLRLRQTEEQLANRATGHQAKGKLAAVGFNSRVKNLDAPRETLQPTRKSRRAS
jgi:chromosome segregation ATPase